MAIFTASFDTGRLKAPAHNNPGRSVISNRWKELAMQMESGMLDQITVIEDDTPLNASGTVTIASGAGTITATINGVGIPITWATSDTNSAALLAAAINASVNALVAGLVTATSLLGVVTVTAARKGVAGNAITLAASGTGATASGARLTAGSNGTTTTIIF